MQWEELTPEQLATPPMSSRSPDTSLYKPLMDALTAGKSVKINLDGVSPKAMQQRLYASANNAKVKITVRTTADKLSVVAHPTKIETPSAPTGQSPPESGKK